MSQLDKKYKRKTWSLDAEPKPLWFWNLLKGIIHGTFGSNLSVILCIHKLLIRILWLLSVTTLFKRRGQTGKDQERMRKMYKGIENRNWGNAWTIVLLILLIKEESPQGTLIVVIRYVRYFHKIITDYYFFSIDC